LRYKSLKTGKYVSEYYAVRHPLLTVPVPDEPNKPDEKRGSFLEQVLAADLERLGIPYTREFRFEPSRKWRSDFRIADSCILVEIEGGAGFGRHSRREGFIADGAKYAAAARRGYIVLRFTSQQVKGRMMPKSESEAVETILCALNYWGSEARETA
jgi:very-short-patch-repair endonuclease